jgi:hypothetical protein
VAKRPHHPAKKEKLVASEPESEPKLKSPVRRSEQDQATANLITEALQLFETARDDPEIAPLIAARGYDAAKLKEGLGLQAAAQAAFTARQTAIAMHKHASAAADGAESTARRTFDDFRETARAVFSAAADRAALGIANIAPKDQQKFITAAHASYTTAQTEPYQAALGTYGFSAQTLTAALATLDAFTAAIEAYKSAVGAAIQATAGREAAMKTLSAWIKQFKKIAAVALRDRPDLRKKLDL